MTRRKQCATISSVYRVIYRAKVPTNWPIKSPDQEHIGRKWTSTPIKKKLAVYLRATIHKYRGQIYGTKCKCYVLLCQTWVRHLWDLAPHPHPTLQLLPKPRQAEVLKRQLNNDSLKKKKKTQVDRIFQWQYLELQIILWTHFWQVPGYLLVSYHFTITSHAISLIYLHTLYLSLSRVIISTVNKGLHIKREDDKARQKTE